MARIRNRLNRLAIGFTLALLLAACGSDDGQTVASMPLAAAAPVITDAPRSVRVGDGEGATFGVTATSAEPLTYQWLRNGAAIAGATGSKFSIDTTQLSDDGTAFDVVVTNANGTTRSASATLTVAPVPPTFAYEMADAGRSTKVYEGSIMSVQARPATGSLPLFFQWRRNGVPIDGETSDTLLLSPIAASDDGAILEVVVSNQAGTVSLRVLVLNVVALASLPKIAKGPTHQYALVGDSVTFTVVAGGTGPFEYQWFRDGVAIDGATMPTLTLSAVSASDRNAEFSARVTNSTGEHAYAEATLSVSYRPGVELLAGDVGGPGTIDGNGGAARFASPCGVAADNAGNVFMADGPRIRRVRANGVVTTLAGGLTAGTADGTGESAGSRDPAALAVDAAGNVYVADSGNHTIRRVTSAGVVTTLAGLAGSSGTTDGQGAAARFSNPRGITIDATGTLYVADTDNHVVRRIDKDGAVVTVAGSARDAGGTNGSVGIARLSSPVAVVVDASSNLFVAERVGTIRRIGIDGTVTTIAGTPGTSDAADGTGSAARFAGPTAMAIDRNGILFVADRQAIRRVTPAGVVVTLAGSAVGGFADGAGFSAKFLGPTGIAIDSAGVSYVADSGNFALRRVDPSGNVWTLAGGPSVTGSADGVGVAARFDSPVGVAVDVDGTAFVADSANHTIRRIAVDGTVTTIAGLAGVPGSTDGAGRAARFNAPQGLALDEAGTLYVVDRGNFTIRKVTPAGIVSTLAGKAGVPGFADGAGGDATFTAPYAAVVDPSGTVYVTDIVNHTVRRITPAGVVTTIAGRINTAGAKDAVGTEATFSAPAGITIDTEGILYIADSGNGTVRRMTSDLRVGTMAGTAGTFGSVDGPSSNATFRSPAGIAAGPGGSIYVLDRAARTVRVINAGFVKTLFGVDDLRSGVELGPQARHLSSPMLLALDSDGVLYGTDVNGILKFTRLSYLGGPR